MNDVSAGFLERRFMMAAPDLIELGAVARRKPPPL